MRCAGYRITNIHHVAELTAFVGNGAKVVMRQALIRPNIYFYRSAERSSSPTCTIAANETPAAAIRTDMPTQCAMCVVSESFNLRHVEAISGDGPMWAIVRNGLKRVAERSDGLVSLMT
jgi:hypothetical protein